METKQNVFKMRLIVAASATILGIGFLYAVGLYASNLLLMTTDDKYEMHGITAVLFGFALGPLTIFPASYLKTGQWGRLLKEFMGVPDDASLLGPALPEEPPTAWGLEMPAAIVLLLTCWVCAVLYCQLLYNSIYEAATDVHVIGIALPALAAEKLQNTIRGTIYNGTFFPLVAASAFLCGWLSKKKLSYSLLLLAAFLVYGMVNLLAVIHQGQASVMGVILHAMAAYQHDQNPGTAAPTRPDSLGLTALLWSLAAALFLLVTVGLAFYGWLWSIGGRWFRQRVEQAR